MRPPDDRLRVRHILDAARKAHKYARDKTRADLDRDEVLALALVRLIETAGEAAGGLSSEFRHTYPGIPWRQLIGMRNRLIHAYFDIDLAIVLEIVKEDFPPLIAQLEPIAAADDS